MPWDIIVTHPNPEREWKLRVGPLFPDGVLEATETRRRNSSLPRLDGFRTALRSFCGFISDGEAEGSEESEHEKKFLFAP